MTRSTVVRFAILFLTLALLPGCTDVEPDLEVVIALADTQYDLTPVTVGDEEVWVFPVYFTAAPTPAAEVSTGDVSGATVIALTATANQPFHITGLRIEQVLYRPDGASSEIGFINPTTFEPVEPFFLELPGGAVIDVPDTEVAVAFEVDVASVAAPWAAVDADGDTSSFLADQGEVVAVTASLFIEGYVGDGSVPTADDFPAPVRLHFELSHKP